MTLSIQTGKTVEEAVDKALRQLHAKRSEVTIEVLEEPSKGLFGLLGAKEAVVKVTKPVDTKSLLDELLDEPLEELSQENIPEEAAPVEEPVAEVPPVSREAAPEAEAEKLQVRKTQEVEGTPEAPEAPEGEVPEAPEAAQPREVEENPTPDNSRMGLPDHVPENKEELDTAIRSFIARYMAELSMDYSLQISYSAKHIQINLDGNPRETGILIGKHGSTLDSLQYLLSSILSGYGKQRRRVFVDVSGYRKKREQTLSRLAFRAVKKVEATGKPVKLEPMSAQERRIIHASLHHLEDIKTHSEGKDPHRRVIIEKIK
ncbi:MAG: RNA-binding cell elongation regulator Jag/EloR [Tissierellia bacterium]|nr:RNA-binding cell elongation regulator Jag/EloR [Tissierellia bacterium]